MRIGLLAGTLAMILPGTAQAQGGQAAIPYSGIHDYGTAATGAQPDTDLLRPTWDQARLSHYHRTLLALRKEALQLQAADGGRLTPAHLDRLQTKIDAAGRLLAAETDGRLAAAVLH